MGFESTEIEITIKDIYEFLYQVNEYFTNCAAIYARRVAALEENVKMYTEALDTSAAVDNLTCAAVYLMKYYYESLLAETKALSEDKDMKSGSKLSFFYRGHSDSNYRLCPSALRKDMVDYEDSLYHEIMVLCPDEFRGLSHLDRLVKMQHYGCPTRLLDITTNPFVALYFACKDYDGSKELCHPDGCVYCFSTEKDFIKYSESDHALILSCLAGFTSKVKKQILNYASKNIMKPCFPYKRQNSETQPKENENTNIKSDKGTVQEQPNTSNSPYNSKYVEFLHHEICREVPAFRHEMKPLDLIRPVFVQPDRANGRILKQDGAFLISGLCYQPEEAEKRLEAYVDLKIRIPYECKLSILEQLDRIGVNEANLFPELDKVAAYLKDKYRKLGDESNVT